MADANQTITTRVQPWTGCIAGGGYDLTNLYFIAIVDSTENFLISRKICSFYDCEMVTGWMGTFIVDVNWLDELRETATLPVLLIPFHDGSSGCGNLRRIAVVILVRMFDDDYANWARQVSQYSARLFLIGLFPSQQVLDEKSKMWGQRLTDYFEDHKQRAFNSKLVSTIPLVGTLHNANISYQLINKIWNSIFFEGILLTSTIGDDIAPPAVHLTSTQAIEYHTKYRATKSWENLFTVKVVSPRNIFYPRYIIIGVKILVDNNRATLDMQAAGSDLILRLFSLPEEIFRKILLYV